MINRLLKFLYLISKIILRTNLIVNYSEILSMVSKKKIQNGYLNQFERSDFKLISFLFTCALF